MNMRKSMLGALVVALVAGVVLIFWSLREEPRPPAEEKSTPAGARARPRPSPTAARASAPEGEPLFTIDEDPRGPLRLEGQVLGADDLPVGDATVVVDARPRREATSEQDGSFVFEGMVGRRYRIWARAGDSTGGPVMHRLTESSEPVVVRLRQGATVLVTVSARGRPLPGASVELRTGDRQQGVSDQRGQVTFRGVREGNRLVTASAEGYATTQKLVYVPRGGKVPARARLVLQEGVPVSGRVLDQAGAPVAGARVGAREMSAIFPRRGLSGRDRVKSDDQGRFRIPALAPGTYRLGARHEQHAPGESRPVEVGTSPVGDVLITLKTGAVLAGKVVTADGQPAAWATIRTGRGEGNRARRAGHFRRATADRDGAFRIAGLPRSRVAVAATSDSASSEIVNVDLGNRARVEDLLLTLSVRGIIAGVVVDSEGQPVPEAQVSAMPDIFGRGALRQLFLRGLGGQITDGGGRFKFRGLPDGTFRLWASRSGINRRMYRALEGTEARTGDTDVRLVLQRPGGVKGAVQDRRGQPVTHFSVTVGASPGTLVADDQGRFEVGGVPPGTHKVTVRCPGYAVVTRPGVAVAAGELTDLGSITVDRGRVVSGRVLDARGAPVAGAEVVVGTKIVGDGKNLVARFGQRFEEASGIRRGESGADGAYSVSGIGEGPQVIAADHPQRGRSLAAQVPVGAKDARLDLTLQPVGSLHGKVTYGGKPAPGVMVVVSRPGTRQQNLLVTTDSEGLYLVARLPAGAHNLMAMSRAGLGGKSAGASVVIKPGQRARADINVEAGEIDLEVKVTGAGGAAIPLAQVFLFKGAVSPKTGKQVQEAFLGMARAGAAMMGFAKTGQPAQFKQVTPAAYSLCVLPINGDIHNPGFRDKLQKHANQLKVYCQPRTVPDSPSKQTVTITSPPMDPLPGEGE
jgi:uncharacterized GH25 family protein